MDDTVVPYLGTSRWIFRLMRDREPDEPWHEWTMDDTPYQAAGFTVRWGSFRFVTVRASGHLLPQKSPKQALAILRMLID
jgi:hypothetical protein